MQPDESPNEERREDGTASAGKLFEDIHELVAAIELNDIFYFEERARRVDAIPEDAPDDDEADEVESGGRMTNSLGVSEMQLEGATGIAFRFRVIFNNGVGAEFVSDVEARYVLPENSSVSDELKQEFAGRVAFMTVYPYIRASIQTMAMRLGVPAPVLGIVRQGGMAVTGEMTEQEIQERFVRQPSEIPGD